MFLGLKTEKVVAFFKGLMVVHRTEFMSTRTMLLSLVCFFWLFLVSAVEASDGGEVSIDGEQFVSCGHGIAGAVLRADADRVLNSVELQMADAPMPKGSFSVSLLSDSGDGQPGAVLAVLRGSEDPSSAGAYSYHTDEPVILEASQRYWIVASVKNESSAYKFQLIEAISSGFPGALCDSFMGLQGESMTPIDASPAMFASFGLASNVLPKTGADRFKVVWTVLLSLVILFCCLDLVPFNLFSFSR